MADNSFARSPLDIQLAANKARNAELRAGLGQTEQAAPQAPASMRDIAIRSQIPTNLLDAVAEAAGVSDLAQMDAFASNLAKHVKDGASIEDAMQAMFPDADVNPILDRASAMAQPQKAAEPEATEQPAEDEYSGKSGLTQALTAVTAGASRALGSSVDEAGERLSQAANGEMRGPQFSADLEIGEDGVLRPVKGSGTLEERPEIEEAGVFRDIGDKIAGGLRGYADKIMDRNVSEDLRKEMQASGVDGSVLDPANIKLKEGTTVRGLAMNGLDAVGSMVPIVIAGLLTGGVGALVTGGAMSGGSARETSDQIIDEAFAKKGEDGRSILETESPLFQRLKASGMDDAEAVELVKRRAGNLASAFAAPIGALGGVATNAIASKGVGALAGKNIAVRTVGGAVISALEEGTQEAAESIAGKTGTKQVTGLNIDVGEGTANDFLLGAISGAPVGAIGGIRGEGRGDATPTEPERLGLPAPDPVAPAAPEVAAPVEEPAPMAQAAPVPPVAPDAPQTFDNIADTFAPAPERPALGPLARAAAAAPLQAPTAPAILPADLPDAAALDIMIPGVSRPVRGEFIAESPNGITVKINGQKQMIPRAEIEAGEVSITPTNLVREAGEAMLSEEQEVKFGQEVIDEPQKFEISEPATQADALITVEDHPTSTKSAILKGLSKEDEAKLEGMKYRAKWNEKLGGYLISKKQAPKILDELNGGSVSENAGMSQAEIAAELERVGVKSPAELQKKPFTSVMKGIEFGRTINGQTQNVRGIDPSSPAAQDLYAAGVDPKSAPGLFRKGGATDLDTIPVSEMREMFPDAPDDGNGYVDRQWIIDGLAEEMGGKPRFTAEQQEAAAQKAQYDELVEAMERGQYDLEAQQAAAEPQRPWSIPAREEDISTDGERMSDISDAMAVYGDALTADERRLIEDDLFANGGVPEYAIQAFLNRADGYDGYSNEAKESIEHEPVKFGPPADEIPFPFAGTETFNAIEPRQADAGKSDGGAEGSSKPEGNAAGSDAGRGGNRTSQAGPRKSETTDAGEQTLIDGVEPVTDKAKAEVQMNKPKRGGDAAADFGLFDANARNQQDMFDAPKPKAKAAPEKSAGTGILGSLSQEKQDRAAELKKRLAAKARTQMSSGLDPEYITLGGELVALYIEAGTRKFGAMLKDFAETTGLTMREAQEPMRAAYGHVRDNMDLNGEDISGMDDHAAVMAEVRRAIAEEANAGQDERQDGEDTTAAVQKGKTTADLAAFYASRLADGAGYRTITEARKEAAAFFGRDLTEGELKTIEEAFESAVVETAKGIAADGTLSREQKFDRLADLYQRQPKLAQRTSTSIEMQAYSTPAPLAFIASRLAGVSPDKVVYEPTAGTGMLVMEGGRGDNLWLNELQADRVDLINRLYPSASVTNGDGAETAPDIQADVVIANPPFGRVKEGGATKTWPFTGSTGETNQIDHAISMKALSVMNDDGSAVLIVGGINENSDDARKKGYQTPKNRAFWKKLYDAYNVVEHFTVDGKMYERQGAGLPVDVVVIKGRKKSEKPYPMKTPPVVYNSWDALKGRIDGSLDSLDPRDGRRGTGDTDARPDATSDAGRLSDATGSANPQVDDGVRAVGGKPDGNSSPVDGVMGQPIPGDGITDTGDAGARVGNVADADPASPVSDGASQDQAKSGDAARDGEANLLGSVGASVPAVHVKAKPAKRIDRKNNEAETSFQVQYSPRSNARFAVGTLVPKNVSDAVQAALSSLEERVGDIDAFVAQKLGYSVDELLGTKSKNGFFSAEQVDALALAIDNVDQGAGFIIGDQTGVGKGRIVAGMIRYAYKSGKTPVFFTVKPGLYGDMVRDLRDIGMGDVLDEIMITNDGMRGSKAIPLSDDPADTLKSGTPAKQSALMKTLRSGKMPEGKKILFTTYDQMNRVREKETDRMKAIEAIAPRAMFILDESHEAGGSASGSRDPKTPPRSEFMRKVLQASPNGKMFSSATFAKNSTVMSLYASTNMRHALESVEKLEGAIENGGVPMLQVVSSGLVNDGQYVRRERTYEGISMEMMVLKSDMKAAENGARAVREIFMLDNEFMTDVRDSYAESLAEEGESAEMDGAIGSGGASSTNFASTMHNVVGQLLLSIKAKEVADKAIALHREGKKPIIALSNTNASIIQDYVSDRGLELGDEVNVPFNEILNRYLQRLRRITIKDADGEKSHHYLTNDEIAEHGGPEALMELQRVEKMLNNIDLSDLPGSPIDYISDRLSQAGVNVEEITGRSKVIRNGVLETRTGGQAENKRIMNRYNNGATDAIIINRSGATGFSMHARKAPDNDGKVRAMLILQPDANIDVFMQMLGRINRTGQSQLPEYYITVSDLAIEKRPAAVLMKKLASLNASTTANKKSAVSLENAPDFMNKHGDIVVNQYLRDNRELSVLTGVTPKKKSEAAGIAAKLTGRLIVLGPERTEEIYRDLEEAYSSYISELDAAGTNDLEAKVLEIDAKTISSQIIAEGNNPESAFGRDTVLETIDAKVLGKPFSEKELRAKIEEALGGRTKEDHYNEQKALLEATFKAQEAADDVRSADLNARLAAVKTQKQRDNVKKLIESHTAKIAARVEAFNDISDVVLNHYAPGTPMFLTMGSGENVATVYAMALGADLSRIDGKSLSPSKIQVKIALGSAARQITVPASRLMASQDSDYQRMNAREEAVFAAFESGQAETRETRQIVTGNVVSGFEKFKGKGQITMFRRNSGELETGIILPKELDAAEFLKAQPVTFKSVDQVMGFLMGEKGDTTGAIVRDDDFGVLKVSKAPYGSHFNVEISRGRGSKSLILNKSARDLVGDFTSRSGAFKKTVHNPKEMKALLQIWSDEVGTRYATDAFKDEANEVINSSKAKHSRQRKTRPEAPKKLTAELQSLTDRMNAEIERYGLKGKITVKALKGIKAGPISLDGFYMEGVIGVSAASDEGPMETFAHEIIHALRDSHIWGTDYGLFTKAEWQALVRQARRMKDIQEDIDAEYSDLDTAAKMEEVIAEMYARWKSGADVGTETASLLQRISDAFNAIVAALRGEGFHTAAEVFAKIEAGQIGRRSQDGGPDGTPPTGGGKMKARRKKGQTGPFPANTRIKAKDERGYMGNLMSMAMQGSAWTTLSLVPGRALLSELGKKMPSLTTYLRLKERMDARRNSLHSELDKVAQEWRKLLKNEKANKAMMDLMADTTIAQIDPSLPFQPKAEPSDTRIINEKSPRSVAYQMAQERLAEDVDRRIEYDALKARFDALPSEYQAMYRKVRDAYSTQADAFEKAVMDNAEKAMKLSIRRAERAHKKRLQEIADDGLTGLEREAAIQEADEKLALAKRTSGWSRSARLQQLRAAFESNRLGGPYFPLKRYGDYFVTARNEEGAVVSFSRFESEKEQMQEVRALRREGLEAEYGVLNDTDGAREAVDPTFVADVETLLEGFDAADELKDMIWQRWLESLPDMSTRKNRIHRKGRAGYDRDAFRAFGHTMFHGAHQLARLEYGMDMGEALDVAGEEAKDADDPNRAGMVLNEVKRRHKFTMNPKGASWSTYASSAAFIYYLAVTPAAAIVNLSQTSVVGTAILGAYRGVGVGAASVELSKALVDFTRGKGQAQKSKRLSQAEHRALHQAYERGVIDKSQAHDLAGVGESGVAYNATHQRVMGAISYFFHHTERMNREVTFLAAYRLAIKKGEGHDQAVETAGDLTWKTHFDYQNNSRPRLMQDNWMKFLLTFRNFQVNMLYRLFRDIHQTFNGEDAETRKEARSQLIGITASMMLHAGVKGTWGYALIMFLLGKFFGGDDDDLEPELEQAVFNLLGREAGSMLLNGVPGALTDTNLTSRMGMPDLWFRSSDRMLEGSDAYNHWMAELIGPVPAIGENILVGASMMKDGNYWRGAETMAPKVLRDLSKAIRYGTDGVTTMKGDAIVENVSWGELFKQAIGFTPARISEQYERNTRMKNDQQRIADEKSKILQKAGSEVMEGGQVSQDSLDAMAEFTKKYGIPLGAKELRASIKGRVRASAQNRGGIVLPKSYENYILSKQPPKFYDKE